MTAGVHDHVQVVIRPGKVEDVASLVQLINSFNEEEGSPGRVDAADVLDLCFSTGAMYQATVAEVDKAIVGYTLTFSYFDTEPCVWGTYMQDLFVVSGRRSEGIGRQLVAFVARVALAQNHQAVFWHVRDRNKRGRKFYRALGGIEETAIPVVLNGPSLISLAAEAS